MAKSKFTEEDDALLAELGVEVEEKKVAARTPREERIIAGFEEIQRFVDENGRVPTTGEDRDIFERLYATRLEQIRRQQDCRDVVAEMDHQGLLGNVDIQDDDPADDMDDDELLAELGVSVEDETDITNLKHVRSQAAKRAAEEIANRKPCEDFDTFKPLFETVQIELASGTRKTERFRKNAGFMKTDIKLGQFFVLKGQTAYVAEVGETIKAPNGETDARLRVVYSNGTEGDPLLRTVVREMYKDETSRLISAPDAGPLFSEVQEEDDLASGTIYVLRSQSNHPTVQENREILHKIGVTGGDVGKRISNAENEATYLLAGVEVVATYELFNINRTKLENLIHKVFEPARLEIEIPDRFGKPVTPREWFLVPLFAIDEAVERIRDGSITEYRYDPKSAQLTRN